MCAVSKNIRKIHHEAICKQKKDATTITTTTVTTKPLAVACNNKNRDGNAWRD